MRTLLEYDTLARQKVQVEDPSSATPVQEGGNFQKRQGKTGTTKRVQSQETIGQGLAQPLYRNRAHRTRTYFLIRHALEWTRQRRMVRPTRTGHASQRNHMQHMWKSTPSKRGRNRSC